MQLEFFIQDCTTRLHLLRPMNDWLQSFQKRSWRILFSGIVFFFRLTISQFLICMSDLSLTDRIFFDSINKQDLYAILFELVNDISMQLLEKVPRVKSEPKRALRAHAAPSEFGGV